MVVVTAAGPNANLKVGSPLMIEAIVDLPAPSALTNMAAVVSVIWTKMVVVDLRGYIFAVVDLLYSIIFFDFVNLYEPPVYIFFADQHIH
jgi:hypothetical protein